jgi:hypothetical protein
MNSFKIAAVFAFAATETLATNFVGNAGTNTEAKFPWVFVDSLLSRVSDLTHEATTFLELFKLLFESLKTAPVRLLPEPEWSG